MWIKTFLLCAAFTLILSGCSLKFKRPHKFKCLTALDYSDVVFVQSGYGLEQKSFAKMVKYLPTPQPLEYIPSNEPYHARDDTSRFMELKNAIYGKAKYIWAIRGGYGSARLFEKLDELPTPKQRKVFIGYSDNTFLNLFFHKWNWHTIHGAMPIEITNPDNEENFELLVELIQQNKGQLKYKSLQAMNTLAASSRNINGTLIGGNLTILTNSLGTNWQLDGNDKIIFIEDVGSKGYVVDRDLMHLKQAGIFKQAKAVLFGRFSESDEHLQYALNRFARDIEIPVFICDFFGHASKNYPLPLWSLSSITANKASESNTTTKSFDLIINYDFSD